jgi:DNA-binding phage protein
MTDRDQRRADGVDIRDAIDAGVSMRQIAQATGYSREHIRRIQLGLAGT